MIAIDLITSAARLCNVVASGEALQVSEANDGLVVFQQMIDAWNADRLAIYTNQTNDFPLVANKQSYTLGTNGDFNIPRPARIEDMSTILTTNPDNPVEVPIVMYTTDDWQNKVPVKNVTGSFPLICYDNGDFPLRTLNFWPIPTQVNNVRLYSWEPLSSPAALQTAVNFPPGYLEAFRYNLAVRLSAEFSAPLPPAVQALAVEAMARVKTMNAPDLSLNSDLSPSPEGYNYRADLFGMGF